jgi:hypothetical protein
MNGELSDLAHESTSLDSPRLDHVSKEELANTIPMKPLKQHPISKATFPPGIAVSGRDNDNKTSDFTGANKVRIPLASEGLSQKGYSPHIACRKPYKKGQGREGREAATQGKASCPNSSSLTTDVAKLFINDSEKGNPIYASKLSTQYSTEEVGKEQTCTPTSSTKASRGRKMNSKPKTPGGDHHEKHPKMKEFEREASFLISGARKILGRSDMSLKEFLALERQINLLRDRNIKHLTPDELDAMFFGQWMHPHNS